MSREFIYVERAELCLLQYQPALNLITETSKWRLGMERFTIGRAIFQINSQPAKRCKWNKKICLLLLFSSIYTMPNEILENIFDVEFSSQTAKPMLCNTFDRLENCFKWLFALAAVEDTFKHYMSALYMLNEILHW